MPELRTFRIGTKRTRVVAPIPKERQVHEPDERYGKRVNYPDRFAFETERKIYGGGPGQKIRAHYQRVPTRPVTLAGIIKALKQVKTETFSIRVLGKLAETPVDYNASDFPPHEYLYLGAVRNTQNALDAALDVPGYLREQPNVTLDWLNEWSTTRIGDTPGWQWEQVATVYISER